MTDQGDSSGGRALPFEAGAAPETLDRLRLGSPAGTSDVEWIIPMIGIMLAQLALLWSFADIDPSLLSPYSVLALVGLGLALVPFTLHMIWRLWRDGEPRPIERIRGSVTFARVAPVIVATMIAPISASIFTETKHKIPDVVPFYLDQPLASFERALFGADAWEISHAVLGWATPLIDRFYLLWLPVMLIAFNLVLLSRPSARKSRSLISYLLVWPVVGTLGTFAFSSAGPIFYKRMYGDGFEGLVPALEQRGAVGTLRALEHLWNAQIVQSVGGGISAMPSVHVAMSVWLALTVRDYFPRFQPAAWTYLVLVWIGSIHLGWHYALDGAVGALGAIAIWSVAPRLTARSLMKNTIKAPA